MLQLGWLQTTAQIIICVDEDVEKLELSYIAAGGGQDVKCSHSEKQLGSPSSG